jgi:hypothetical protein
MTRLKTNMFFLLLSRKCENSPFERNLAKTAFQRKKTLSEKIPVITCKSFCQDLKFSHKYEFPILLIGNFRFNPIHVYNAVALNERRIVFRLVKKISHRGEKYSNREQLLFPHAKTLIFQENTKRF